MPIREEWVYSGAEARRQLQSLRLQLLQINTAIGVLELFQAAQPGSKKRLGGYDGIRPPVRRKGNPK